MASDSSESAVASEDMYLDAHATRAEADAVALEATAVGGAVQGAMPNNQPPAALLLGSAGDLESAGKRFRAVLDQAAVDAQYYPLMEQVYKDITQLAATIRGGLAPKPDAPPAPPPA
jgi:hypothetical protein